MDEHGQQCPWYQRPILPRWFPAWLVVCLAAGAMTCVGFWFGLGGLSGIGLALCFGGGFTVTLWILSQVGRKTSPTDPDSDLSPPRWLSLPAIAAGLGIGIYAWVLQQLQAPAPPANLAPPAYAAWLLLGCAGWFAFRLLWRAWDVCCALWAAGEPQRLLWPGLWVSIVAGAAGGFALVVFLWPQAQHGWRQYIAVAALLPGLVVGFALDIFFWRVAALLTRWLLAFRLPHFQEQLRSADAAERARAAGAIYHMGRHAAAAVPELIEAVKDESAEVRTQAALALWSSAVNDPILLATLHALLRDPEARVRIAAAGALVDLGAGKPSEVVPIFAEGLMHPHDQFAKWISAHFLGRLGPEAAPSVPALRAALFDRQPPNEAALDALDRIGEAGTTILADALRHPDRSFRKTAADLLGRKGATAAAAVPALKAALADEDETVRHTAAQALKRIDGR